MPEGDTIHRAAATLRARLGGKKILAWSSPLPQLARANLVGHTITKIEAVGKNLFMVLDDGRVVHSHMRMKGSWHVYPPSERGRARTPSARATIEVEGCVAICFSAPVVRILSGADALREQETLGPDLLAAEFDVGGAAERVLARGKQPIGEVVMDQGVVAGIGNIYKSECLYIARINPFAGAASIGAEKANELMVLARRLMKRNLSPGIPMRTTRVGGSSRVWVYKRSGEACFTCGTKIRMKRQGEMNRSTYYCPACQNVEGET